MGRKAYRKPVPQIVEKAQTEVGSDKNIDHGFEHQGREAGSTVNQKELRKQNNMDKSSTGAEVSGVHLKIDLLETLKDLYFELC